MKIILPAFLLLLGMTSVVEAQIPQMISYQGYITDHSGKPITDTENVLIELFTEATGGSKCWSHEYSQVPIINGIYNIIMDFSIDWVSAYDKTKFDRQLWLQAFGASTRTRLTGVPYSFSAIIADSAKNAAHSIVANSAEVAQSTYFDAPVGCVQAYAGNYFDLKDTIGTHGWMLCDGRALSRKDFPRLDQAIGALYRRTSSNDSINLPDLRALFLRGANAGRTDSLSDPAWNNRISYSGTASTDINKVGTLQNDAFQGHWHYSKGTNYSTNTPGNSGVNEPLTVTDNSVSTDLHSVLAPVTDGTHGTPRVDLETHPKNAYVYWIIKVK